MQSLLPHGLDDLDYGVEHLPGDCLPADRERVAGKIASDLAGIVGTATRELIFAAYRFAAMGGNGDNVRKAFHRFAVEICRPSASANRQANGHGAVPGHVPT